MKHTSVIAGLTALFFLFSQAAVAQNNNTSSPTTRYGYGKLADGGFATQRAMGGIGIGYRHSKTINMLNPASFSAVDSMTFMLDFGLTGQVGLLHDGTLGQTSRKTNAGLDYVALQFPLAKGLGFGAGLTPVSFVGYQMREINSNTSTYTTSSGSGGLQKVYGTLSYRFLDRFAVGVNLGYLFGETAHSRNMTPPSTGDYYVTAVDSLSARALTYQLGAQYMQPLSKNQSIVVGAVYTPKIKMNTTAGYSELSYNSSGTLISRTHSPYDEDFYLPETFGAGLSYNQLNKLTAGADFQYQRWADAQYYGKTDTLNNRMKISLGGEYIPDYMGEWYSRIRYRFGLSYADSYITDKNGSQYKEYGVSLGFGIPLIDRRSFVNFALEYSLMQPSIPTSMREQYFKLTFSYTFNELWFFKRKLQ
jgi:hypothetical protein